MAVQSPHHRSYEFDSRAGSIPRAIVFHSVSRTSQKSSDSRGRFKLLSPRSPRFVPRSATYCNVDVPVNTIRLRYSNVDHGIRDVWKSNLEEEFKKIRSIVQKYHYVAMAAKFMNIGKNIDTLEDSYGQLRYKVNLLRITQLGLTFLDEDGNTPPECSAWQFNFSLGLGTVYSMDSLKLNEYDGIGPQAFAELLMMSGIVLVDNIKFICFQSGYDLGYLIKLLTNQDLPETEAEYNELAQTYFPEIYDIKNLMMSCKLLSGGLQKFADQPLQAGYGAILLGLAFFDMLSKECFDPISTYLGQNEIKETAQVEETKYKSLTN